MFSILVNDDVIQSISKTRNLRVILNSSLLSGPLLHTIHHQAGNFLSGKHILNPAFLLSTPVSEYVSIFCRNDLSHFSLAKIPSLRSFPHWTPKFLQSPLLPLHATSRRLQVLLLPENDVPICDSQCFASCPLCLKCPFPIATLGKLLFICQGPNHELLPL